MHPADDPPPTLDSNDAPRDRNGELASAGTEREPLGETLSWSEADPTVTSNLSTTQLVEKPCRAFGEYDLIEEIARGGMGVVYKARQRKLNRVVALKMILAGRLAGEEEILRFRAEAEAAAGLDHPGVVPIYEVGDLDGQHFFSMGFIDGISLSKRIAQSPISSFESARILRCIADAVEYAHQQGVIHRDLKPSNVLLKSRAPRDGKRGEEPSGDLARSNDSRSKNSHYRTNELSVQPLVTDFGLAKRLQSNSDLTASGQILGTPSYMPPEQARGLTQQIGVRSDVYSLGAILYSMLTGRPPFQGTNVVETIRQVCEHDPVPPRQLNPEISRDLETICLKCLEKDPNRRYQVTSELIDDLDAYLDGRPVKSRPIGAFGKLVRWSARKPVVAGLIAAVFLVSITGLSGIIWQWQVAQHNFSQSQIYLGEARENLASANQSRKLADEQRVLAEASFDLARNTVSRFLTIVPNHELVNKPGMEPVKRDLQLLGRDYYLKLSDARPADHEVQRGLAQSHFFLAMTLEDIGDSSQAAAEYTEAAQIFDRLTIAFPTSMEDRRNLAASYGNLANVQINLGLASEGIETYLKIRDLQQKIIDENPQDSVTTLHLAMTNLNLALMEIETGQFDAAMESARQSNEIAARLAPEFATDFQVQYCRAKAATIVARLHWERKDYDDALNEYDVAAGIWRTLIEQNPQDPDLHHSLSEVLSLMSSVHGQRGEIEEADALLNSCVGHAEAAHEKAPEVVLYREGLANRLHNRSIHFRNTGRFDSAFADLTRIRDTVEQPDWLFSAAVELSTLVLVIDANADKLTEDQVAKRAGFATTTVDWLRDAVDAGFVDHAKIIDNPVFEVVREQPSFKQLVDQLQGK